MWGFFSKSLFSNLRRRRTWLTGDQVRLRRRLRPWKYTVFSRITAASVSSINPLSNNRPFRWKYLINNRLLQIIAPLPLPHSLPFISRSFKLQAGQKYGPASSSKFTWPWIRKQAIVTTEKLQKHRFLCSDVHSWFLKKPDTVKLWNFCCVPWPWPSLWTHCGPIMRWAYP